MSKYAQTLKYHATKGTKPSLKSAILTNDEGRFVDFIGNEWPMTVNQAFAAWYLMRGGIDDPLRLKELLGLQVSTIAWEDLFRVCDNMAPKLRPVESDITRLALAKGKTITCGGCGVTLKHVPCLTCKRPDYVSRRLDQALWETPNSHGYVATGTVVRSHLSAYHGGGYRDQ